MQENQNSNKNKNESKYLLPFVFLFLISVDQFTKFFSGNVFKNSVFAFSLPLPVWLIYTIYALVLGAMLGYCLKNYQKFSRQQSLAWVVIFSGAVSNIGERIILGYVRDWIFILSGIFNLADLYIIAGIVLLLLQQFIDKNDIIDKIEHN